MISFLLPKFASTNRLSKKEENGHNNDSNRKYSTSKFRYEATERTGKEDGMDGQKDKIRKEKYEIDKAIADINKGDVKGFSSVRDMMNYLNT